MARVTCRRQASISSTPDGRAHSDDGLTLGGWFHPETIKPDAVL